MNRFFRVWGAHAPRVLVAAPSPKRTFPEGLATDAVVSEIESIDTSLRLTPARQADFHRSIKVPFPVPGPPIGRTRPGGDLPDSFALRPERESHTAERVLGREKLTEIL